MSLVDGTSATLGGSVHIVPPMYYEPGYVAPFSARLKEIIDIPVIVTGRINQPHEAEKILKNNAADMCGI